MLRLSEISLSEISLREISLREKIAEKVAKLA